MRTIKFRAWDKKRNRWLHGYESSKDGCDILGETILLGAWMSEVKLEDLNDIDVMQFTGLKDIKGKEIYEGDILEYEDLGSITDSFVEPVRWNEEQGYFCTESSDHVWAEVARMSEVVGNIYENPDLV